MTFDADSIGCGYDAVAERYIEHARTDPGSVRRRGETMQLHVTPAGTDQYDVTVEDGGSRSQHRVRVSDDDAERFGGGATAERLLEESFRFLLEREPKESILSSFDLPIIARYFPEYPKEIRRRLGN